MIFILKENQQTLRIECQLCDKFAPNYLGSYIIKKQFGSGAYQLVDMEGKHKHETINITHLHPFYT